MLGLSYEVFVEFTVKESSYKARELMLS